MIASRRGRAVLRPTRAPRSDAERLDTLLAVQRAIAGARDLNEALAASTELALAFVGLAAAAAFIETPTGDRVLVRAWAGSTSRPGVERLTLGTVLRGPLAALHQQAMAAGHPLQHVPALEPAQPPPGHPAAYVVIPLIGGSQRAVGTLALFSPLHCPLLPPEDVAILQAIAGQLAPIVESAQLHEQLDRARDELLTLNDAGQAISSSLDLQRVLSGILEMSRRLARADCCLLTSLNPASQPTVLAERGTTPDWLAYRTTPSVRLTINAVLRDGTPRPLGMPPVTGWCVALKIRQQVIGALEVYARDGVPRYGESHLLAGLATQAAIAIENAKLYQAVRDKEAHLQDFVKRMIQAQEEDRRQVAYDIHDGLAQLMVSAHQHVQTFSLLNARREAKARQEPKAVQAAKADQALAKGMFMLQKSIEEVRKVIAGLRPSELDDFGLVAAIQLYVQALRDDFGWQVEVVENVGPARLSAPVEVTTYRIVQEALTNARRHGDARRARVMLERRELTLLLEVQDWGGGFDVATLEQRAPGQGKAGHHVGLHSMRERAHLLGGTFQVESAPGSGTVIRVSVPIVASVDAADVPPFALMPAAVDTCGAGADGDPAGDRAVGAAAGAGAEALAAGVRETAAGSSTGTSS